MAYQFGVLVCIVIAATIALSGSLIALWRGDPGIAAGVAIVFVIIYWYWEVPDGFMRRVHLLFRDGVPLAPYGFRRNATLGYWLGIPIIYIGHLITAGTLYLAWELAKRPVEGVPLGIGFGFAIMAYALGIGLVESSYRLWAKRLDGVTPGDPGSSPKSAVFWSISVASTLTAMLYVIDHPVSPNGNSALNAQNSQSPAVAQLAPDVRVGLVDFIAVTEADWAGKATYRMESANRLANFPAALHGSLSEGDTVQLKIDFPGSSRDSEELRFQLNDDGGRLNDLPIVERTELANGMIRIVAYGDGQHNGAPAKVRKTFILASESFRLQHHVEQEAGRFILRDEYEFSRSAQ